MDIGSRLQSGFKRAIKAVKTTIAHPELFWFVAYMFILIGALGFLGYSFIAPNLMDLTATDPFIYLKLKQLLTQYMVFGLVLFAILLPMSIILWMWVTHGCRTVVKGKRVNWMKSLKASFNRLASALTFIGITGAFIIVYAYVLSMDFDMLTSVLSIIAAAGSIIIFPFMGATLIDERVRPLDIIMHATRKFFARFYELIAGVGFFMLISLGLGLIGMLMANVVSYFPPGSFYIAMLIWGLIIVAIHIFFQMALILFTVDLYESR